MNTFKLTAEYLKNPGSAETQARRIEYHAFYTGQHDVECEAKADHILLRSAMALHPLVIELLKKHYSVAIEELVVEGEG
jgi:hypothetical protein